MRNVTRELLYILAASLILAPLSCDQSGNDESQAPGIMPAVVADALTSADDLSVVWILTPADCLSCARQDVEVREALNDLAPGQFVAVTFGDSVARNTVSVFLTRSRIDVPVVALTADEWLAHWQTVQTPEILVYDGPHLEWAASKRYILADSVELLRNVIARLTEES